MAKPQQLLHLTHFPPPIQQWVGIAALLTDTQTNTAKTINIHTPIPWPCNQVSSGIQDCEIQTKAS